MTYNPNFITKLVTTLAIFPIFATPAPAQAGGCYTSTAAHEVANMVRGGIPAGEAIAESARRGHLDSKICVAQMVGYMRSNPYVFGDVVN